MTNIKRLIKFGIVGLSGVIVNEGLLYILTEFAGIFYLISGAISIEASILTNFILNDFWTFKDKVKNSKKSFFGRLISWNLARLLTVIINLGILWILTYLGIHYLVSNLVGILFATIVAYILSLVWVWN